jgi:uncharacterized protein (TIGR03437 family)
MSHRNLSFAVCVCLAATVAAFGQANQGTGYLFQFAGYPSTSSQFLGYVATGNLNASINTSGPSGISQIIPKPDGSKFYLIGSGTTSAIQAVDPTFTQFSGVNGFDAPPTAAAITPNGKYLLVAADAFYIVDTTSNQVVSTLQMTGAAAYGPDDVPPNAPVPPNGFCSNCWIAVSRDSTTAYVLTNLNGASQVNTYSLTNLTRGTTITGLGGDATSISISPLGLIYVTSSNRIFVIDPTKLEVTANGTLELFDFEPYALRFSPDGTTAYAVNRIASQAGESMLQLNLNSNAWAYWPARGTTGAPQFDDVFVASNSRLFAYSSALTTLFDVTASPFAATQSTSLGLSNAAVENISAVAITNEVPSAQSLFLLVNLGNQVDLYRESLSSNSTSTEGLAGLSSGQLQFAVVPPETAPASFLQFNNNQSLTPGTTGVTSQPLIARVTNVGGQPLYNVQVNFAADPNATGITINTPAPTTNADGYVQTTVSIAAGATCPNASCAITLTAGSASVTFTITLPDSNGGGGGGSTSSQVTIVGGNGQMLNAISGGVFQIPLQVLVTDTKGNPLPNIAVTFQVNSGSGGLSAATSVTDSSGLASPAACNTSNPPVTGCVYFISGGLQPGTTVETDYVSASTQYGTATFTELIFEPVYQNGQLLDLAEVLLEAPTPSDSFTISIPAGAALPNAIIAQINQEPSAATNGQSSPIAGVSLTPVGVNANGLADLTVAAPASCQAGTGTSSSTGLAQCTLVASCQIGPHGLYILVGNYHIYGPGTLEITGGTASKIVANGSGQTGTAGQTLQPLVATITDGCNNPVAGIAVSWTVTEGSATLSNTVNSSNSNGQVSSGVTLGQTPGTVTIRVSASGLPSVNFTLTNAIVVTGISIQSGSPQTAVAGTAFANPLTFVVTGNSGPVAGILVTFVVASGSATVNPTTATSNAQGVISTTVTAGTVPGPVVVTANGAGFTTAASLTVQAPGPSITSASFYNAASFQPGLVPCGLATVIGTGIAPNVTGVLSGSSGFGPLPYTLGGVSITINLEPVPLYSISNENGSQQATFQTPCDISPGTALVVVTVNNGTPTTITGVPVYAAQPGIFTYAGPNNIQYGAVISALNGSYVTPSNLAVPGQTYYLVATGLGQTNPPTTTNSAGIAGENVDAQIVVGVNNNGVPVVSAQYLAGSIGVYIVGFQIPANASPGTNIPLALAAIINNGGQVVYGNPVFLPGIQ